MDLGRKNSHPGNENVLCRIRNAEQFDPMKPRARTTQRKPGERIVSRAGFSFHELMIALSLASIVALALGALALYTAKRFIATTSEVELSSASRNAMNCLL